MRGTVRREAGVLVLGKVYGIIGNYVLKRAPTPHSVSTAGASARFDRGQLRPFVCPPARSHGMEFPGHLRTRAPVTPFCPPSMHTAELESPDCRTHPPR